MREFVSAAGGILCVAALLPYIVAIIRKKVKPPKATWTVWASLDVLTTIGMYLAGTLNPQMVGAALCALVIMILSFKYGKPGWKRLDKYCLGGAGLGIVVLIFKFNDPTWSIVISQSVALIGSFPILQSAWRGEEHKLTWSIFIFSCILTLASLPVYTLASLVQPVNFTLLGGLILGFLFLKKHPKPQTEPLYLRKEESKRKSIF